MLEIAWIGTVIASGVFGMAMMAIFASRSYEKGWRDGSTFVLHGGVEDD